MKNVIALKQSMLSEIPKTIDKTRNVIYYLLYELLFIDKIYGIKCQELQNRRIFSERGTNDGP